MVIGSWAVQHDPAAGLSAPSIQHRAVRTVQVPCGWILVGSETTGLVCLQEINASQIPRRTLISVVDFAISIKPFTPPRSHAITENNSLIVRCNLCPTSSAEYGAYHRGTIPFGGIHCHFWDKLFFQFISCQGCDMGGSNQPSQSSRWKVE